MKKQETNTWCFDIEPRQNLEPYLEKGKDYGVIPSSEGGKPCLIISDDSKVIGVDALSLLEEMTVHIVGPQHREAIHLTFKDFKSFMWGMYQVKV